MGVVFHTVLHEFDGGFEIVEESMDIYVSDRVIICNFGELIGVDAPANSTVTCKGSSAHTELQRAHETHLNTSPQEISQLC